MKLKPKKWRYEHLERLYHISNLVVLYFILALLAVSNFFMFRQIRADQYSLPPLEQTISATVPGIAAEPAVVNDNPGQSSGPLPIPPKTFLYGTKASVTISTLNNSVFTTQFPEFKGQTNIRDALIFLEIHSTVTIHSSTYVDANGDWSWVSPEPVSVGPHELNIYIQSFEYPEIVATANLHFAVNLQPGQKEQPPSVVLNKPSKTGSGVLFDVFARIPDQFKIIAPGDQLVASISLINFGSSGHPVDVGVEYTIFDSEGHIVFQISETSAVATRLSILKTFNTNPQFKPGIYKLVVKVPSKDLIATAADTFEIKGPSVLQVGSVGKVDFTVLFQTLLAMMFLFCLIIYLEHNKIAVLSHFIKKVDDLDLLSEIK
jgi:hypothetical protein